MTRKMTQWILACLAALFLLMAGSMCLAQQELGRSDTPRASRIRADLQEILRSGGYEGKPAGEGILSKIGSWIAEKWNAFADWLRKVFSFSGRIGTGPGSMTVLPYILVVALILLIAYAIVYAVKNYQRGPRTSKRKPSVDISAEPEESADAEPDAWIAAARRHAAAGDYRKAYRAVFLAILIRLDRHGAIRFEPSKTNGDYVRSLRCAPDMLAFLRPLANDFDARWYGHVEATARDFNHMLAQYEAAPGSAS